MQDPESNEGREGLLNLIGFAHDPSRGQLTGGKANLRVSPEGCRRSALDQESVRKSTHTHTHTYSYINIYVYVDIVMPILERYQFITYAGLRSGLRV